MQTIAFFTKSDSAIVEQTLSPALLRHLLRSHLLLEDPLQLLPFLATIVQTETGAYMTTNPGEVTHLLHQWQGGNRSAESKLFELLMPELHRIAAYCFRNERPGHTLQPTALVNEAFLRLASAKKIDWRDRGHFLALAARVMRRYLIDHARAEPHVDLRPIEALPEGLLGTYTRFDFAVAIDDLLDELELESCQQRAVVELKFFLGLTDMEAAAALSLSLHTFQREWYRARKWLFERLTSPAAKRGLVNVAGRSPRNAQQTTAEPWKAIAS